MGFKYSIYDSNMSMRPLVIPDDKEYCDYLIIYVDDILFIYIDPDATMNQLREQFKLKNSKWKSHPIIWEIYYVSKLFMTCKYGKLPVWITLLQTLIHWKTL